MARTCPVKPQAGCLAVPVGYPLAMYNCAYCNRPMDHAADLRQALSMSILRGDKGCSLGAIEANTND